MFDPALTNLIILSLLALIVDSVIGGRKFLGRIPGPDRLFFSLVHWFEDRLDKKNRSNSARVWRGGGVLFLCGIIVYYLGSLVDKTVITTLTGQIFCLFLLSLILGQKLATELVTSIASAVVDPRHRNDQSKYGAIRWSLERLTLRFSDGLVANLAFLLIDGFSLLLLFRLVSVTIAAGAPSGLLEPESPYYKIPTLLFKIVAFIPALIAGLTLSVAAIFVPGAKALKLPNPVVHHFKHNVPSRLIPMSVLARTQNLSFRLHSEKKGTANWIGPTDGRARPEAPDIRRAVLLMITAELIVGLVLLSSLFYMI